MKDLQSVLDLTSHANQHQTLQAKQSKTTNHEEDRESKDVPPPTYYKCIQKKFSEQRTRAVETAATYQTGSLIAHSWLVVKNNPLSTFPLHVAFIFAIPICLCCCCCCCFHPSPPNNLDLCKLFHSPNSPTAAAGGVVVIAVAWGCGAMITRTSGRTCERRKSAAPIIRAIVGIASAPPIRRPKLADVSRIVRAKSSSFTGGAAAAAAAAACSRGGCAGCGGGAASS